MSERTAAEIRAQIASERASLGDDLNVLRGQVRSLVPFAVAGAIGIVVLSKGRHLASGVKLLMKLR
jgi:hypothetical protein